MRRALIIVDVQNDFCETGALPVPQGSQIIPVINSLRETKKWDLVVLTKDWHPADHISFAVNNNAKEFSTITLDDGTQQTMWPKHCVQGTEGAEFHKDLKIDKSDVVVTKGSNPKVDSYSGFFDNNKKEKTQLDSVLKKAGITEVYICGLALDYCVQYTAIDAAELGYKTYLVMDGCKGISNDTSKEAITNMKKAGVSFISSKDVQ